MASRLQPESLQNLFGLRVEGLGFRVEGLRFRVSPYVQGLGVGS